jgi:glycosyltransferase involved in cell wall biosynthesis
MPCPIPDRALGSLSVRIAVVAEQILAPVPGGIARYTCELMAGLARTAGPQDSVTGWTAWHRQVSRAEVAGAAGPRRLALARRPLIAAWEHGLGPAPRAADVVHAPSLLWPPRRGAPLVVSIHDTVPWTHPEALTPRGVRWHRAMAERAVLAGAAIGVLTHVVGEQLLDVLPGLAASHVHLLGAGVSRALAALPDPGHAAEVRTRLSLPDRFVLTLATLEPRKGLDVLVDALALLGERAPPLVVAGQPGWGGVDLDASARAAGLPEGAVRAIGFIDDADLAVVLRAASALIAPSRAEGFGLPVAEAMSVATPVICSDDPALLEVSGGAALVVPRRDAAKLAEAIDGLLGDDALRTRLAAAGRQRAAAYDWDAVAQRTWALYRGLAAPPDC